MSRREMRAARVQLCNCDGVFPNTFINVMSAQRISGKIIKLMSTGLNPHLAASSVMLDLL